MQAALKLNEHSGLALATRRLRATPGGVFEASATKGFRLSTPVMSLNTHGLPEPLPLIGFYAICGEATRPSLSSKPASLASS